MAPREPKGAEVMAALSVPVRREIVKHLLRAPRSVNELAERLPVTQPAVSQHLRVLSEVGLIEATREGTRRIYRVRREGLAQLREYVESMWDDAMRNFQQFADKRGGRRDG